MKHELDVIVIYWRDGFYHKKIGIVEKVDMQAKRIKLRFNNDIEYVDFDCLKCVERL
jgi:hypothetical protein